MEKSVTRLIGDPVLRETAAPAPMPVNTRLKDIIQRCQQAMRANELIGFAAPQLGESIQVFVTELRPTPTRSREVVTPFTAYINPEITYKSPETELGYEGCGSIPDLFGQVERAYTITISFTDQTGVKRVETASGLLARVIQHEYDHLNGILFTDRADPQSLVVREHYLKHK